VAKQFGKDQMILVNVSGRGDKDIFTVADKLGADL
jgi:tryptophan synthase beta chain